MAQDLEGLSGLLNILFSLPPSLPWRCRIRRMRSTRFSALVFTAAAYFLFPPTSSHLSMMGKDPRKYRATSARVHGGSQFPR